ncbi:MAG: nucleoside deaminase [Clostridia bacterium]
MSEHEAMMSLALAQAQKAFDEGEIPVGAVIACCGKPIAQAHNLCETNGDPTAHAEMLVIREATRILGTKWLDECTLYVTLEPCPMCAGALVMARMGACYFAAQDERQGCAESVYALTRDPAFYHRLTCVGGLLANEAQQLLTRFFKAKRTNDKGAQAT